MKSVVAGSLVVLIFPLFAGPVTATQETDITIDEPETGYYLKWTTREVYWYQSPPGTLTNTGVIADETENPDQDGVCMYTGEWHRPGSSFVAGRCISMRVDNETEKIHIRIDIKELTGPTLSIRLEYELSDSNESHIGTQYPKKYICTSGRLVRECVAESNTSLNYEGSAERVCVFLRLYELHEDGSHPDDPNLQVAGGCVSP